MNELLCVKIGGEDDRLLMDALPHVQVGPDELLYAVYDSETGVWYELPREMYGDLMLQSEGDDDHV